MAYYRRGNEADFVRILEMSGSEASLDYAEYHQDQMRALDTLAAYYVIQVLFLFLSAACFIIFYFSCVGCFFLFDSFYVLLRNPDVAFRFQFFLEE